MYTLINQELFNGSVVLLFPDQLKVFAEQTGTDLILLPSSVNELICLEKSADLDYGRLRNIVMSVNRTCVCEDEILSDQLYQYVRSENRVKQMCIRDSPYAVKKEELSEIGVLATITGGNTVYGLSLIHIWQSLLTGPVADENLFIVNDNAGCTAVCEFFKVFYVFVD